MSKNNFLFFILFLVINSCSSVNKDVKNDIVNSDSVENLKKIAKEKFDDNFELIYNSNKDFVLCTNLNKSKTPGPESINYFVYDLVKNKITYKGNIPQGSISWMSDYEIKLKKIPGTIQRNGPVVNIYKLDVKTNNIVKIN